MKRSEVVNKIYNYLLHESGDSNDPTHQHNAMLDAEAILWLVERSGMLPPSSFHPAGHDNVSYVMPDPKTGEYVGAVKINEWEPE